MQSTITCTACRTVTHPPKWERQVPFPVKCRRCGAAYNSETGERIGPDMFPLTGERDNLRRSPWMPTHTRPVLEGAYEVRFRHTEPHVLTLWWIAGRWWERANGGRPVNGVNFLSWRGAWV